MVFCSIAFFPEVPMAIHLQNLNEQVRELQPPSARDRLIFEAVVVKGRGQAEVAAEQGISQPRVSQIVAEVGEWLSRALPQGRKNESPAGEMAVAAYVVEAQIDFLLQRTMHDIEESRKERVTEKAGTRGAVQWTEVKTEKRPIVKVGLLNAALRLSQAKAKLAGVDVTGRTQREAALAWSARSASGGGGEVVARERQVPLAERADDREAKEPLMKKTENRAVIAETVQPQALAAHEDKRRDEREEFIKNTACKQLINHLREDPRCAGWTEKQFREYAQFVWDTRDEAGVPDPLSRGEREGQRPKMRSHRNRRGSPQQRRRKFLAPLAAAAG
jgi:hypothetical protein